jgi:hypothetical protein
MTMQINPEENSKFQALCVRERILVTLLDGQLHFSPLMKKVMCSRGVLNTHLRNLRKDKLVRYGEHDENYKFCCPSALTEEGVKEARDIEYAKIFKGLPYPTKERIILSYKSMVLHHLDENSNKPAIQFFRVPSPLEKSKGVKRIPTVRGGPFIVPKDEPTAEQVETLSKMNNRQRFSEQRKRSIEAVDKVLRIYGFLEDEILRMWLGYGQLIAEILRFRSEKSEHSQEEIEQMKHKIREHMTIRENLENGIVSNVKHPNLFP